MIRTTFLFLLIGHINILSAQSSSATANASVTIVQPISIETISDLNFGSIESGNRDGAVSLASSGSRKASGGITLPASGGSFSLAAFRVTGEGNFAYSVNLPSTVTLSLPGAETMSISDFEALPGQLTNGEQTLYVGATLYINRNQAPGTYTSGTPFTVTVNYQ